MPGNIPALSLQAIRPMDCQILMGKNTLMKRCIRLYCENKQDDVWGALVPELVGNVGILFVSNDFSEIKEVVELRTHYDSQTAGQDSWTMQPDSCN